MTLSSSISSSKTRTKRVLRTLAVFKILKSVLLLCLGFGAFKLLTPAVGEKLTHWINSLSWNYDKSFLLAALTKLTGLEPIKLKAFGVAAFLYAILFIIEGIGLWFEKRWAEFLTVIATGSFLPLEVYEVSIRFTYARGITLLINVLIFIYLVGVVRRKPS